MSFWKKRPTQVLAAISAVAALGAAGIAGSAVAFAAPDSSSGDARETAPTSSVDAAPAVLAPISGPAAGGEDVTLTGPYEMPKFVQVEGATGGDFALGVSDKGLVYAWGDNTNGQLGTGDKVPSGTPVQVQGLPAEAIPVKDVAGLANLTGYALGNDGNVYAWGFGENGQLGNGSTVASLTPVKVDLQAKAKQVVTALTAAYALMEDGSVYAWGLGTEGRLGNGTNGTNGTAPTPVQVKGGAQGGDFLDGIVQMAASTSVYVLDEAGTVYAWGRGKEGGLGNGAKNDSNTPVKVNLPASAGKVTKLAAAVQTGFVVTEGGDVYGWGDNYWGEIGTPYSHHLVLDQIPTPRLMQGLDTVKVTDINASFRTIVVLAEDGALYSWGIDGTAANTRGSLGAGPAPYTGINGNQVNYSNGGRWETPVPVKVVQTGILSGVSVKELGRGSEHALFAVGEDGKVYAWGTGPLGNEAAAATVSNVPVLSANFSFPIEVSWTHLLPSGTRAAAGAQAQSVEVTQAVQSGSGLALSMNVPAGVAGDTADVVGRSWTLFGGRTPSAVNSPDWQTRYYTYLLDEDLIDFDKTSAFNLGTHDFKAGATADFTLRLTNRSEGSFVVTSISEASFNGVDGSGTPVGLLKIESCSATVGGETSDVSITPGSVVEFDPALTLGPLDELVCTTPYALSQGDIDAGGVQNTAKVTVDYVEPTSGDTALVAVEVEATEDVTGDASVAWEFHKEALLGGPWAAGTAVDYTFTVENHGNVTLHDLDIAESAFTGSGGLSSAPTITGCFVGETSNPAVLPVTSLPPAEQLTCTASYLLTQADVDQGTVANTATLSGTDNLGDPLVESGDNKLTDDAVVSGIPAGSVAVSQSVDSQPANGQFKAGKDVVFNVTVTNDGAATLTGVELDKTLTSGTLSCPTDVFPLAPGDSYNCTLTYKLTQDDADALQVTSTVTAVGKYGAGGDKETAPASDSKTVTGTNTPQVSIVKDASYSGALGVGTVVEYTYTVTNMGDTSISEVTVVETDFTGNGTLPTPVCSGVSEASPLLVGQSVVCTASYTVTQADLDQGGVNNTAIATAKAVDGRETAASEDSASAFTGNDLKPELSLTGNSQLPGGSSAGDGVDYTFTVTNTGPVTVTGVVVGVGPFTGTNAAPTLSCTPTTLAPGESATCTGSYALSQADVDAGSVNATGTASGKALGVNVTSDPADAPVDLEPEEGLMVAATTTKVPTGEFAPGQSVSIPVTVTNNGDTTLTEVTFEFTVFDGVNGAPSGMTCTPTTLAPGGIASCTVDYVLGQADVDEGGFDFTVQATGNGPAGSDVISPVDDGRVEGEGVFELTLEVAGALDGGQVFEAGATGSFTFTVTNTGAVTAGSVTANNLGFTGSDELGEITCAADTLAPGASTTCTANYTLSQADVDQAGVTLTGNASGTYSVDKTGISNQDAGTINGVPENVLTVVKSVARDAGEQKDPFVVGDTVTYTFEVVNAGAGTLAGLTLDEANFGGSGDLGAITCQVADDTGLLPEDVVLAPGAEATCSAVYALTATDLEGKVLVNTVTAGSKWNTADVVSQASDATLDIYVAPPTPEKPEPGKPGTEKPGTQEPGGAGGLAVTGSAMAGILALAGALLTAGLILTGRRKNEAR